MFFDRSMPRKLITIDPGADIIDAKNLMDHHRIRQLSVCDSDRRLLGIVTDRDLRSALPGEGQSQTAQESSEKLRIGDIMTPEPLTISPDFTIQQTLKLFKDTHYSAFPVTDRDNRVKSILSITDLMDAFINFLGIGEPGTLLCVVVEEKVGQMKKIVDIVTEENISLGSVLVVRHWEPEKKAVFPYLLTNNVVNVKRKLRALGFELPDPLQWRIDEPSP